MNGPRVVRFGSFEFELSSGELRSGGRRVRLQSQPAQLLARLVSTPGRIVTREELRRGIWGEDTFVDFDAALNVAVNKVRQALHDSASAPRFIETVPKRGYRFLADVHAVGQAPVDAQTATLARSTAVSAVRWPLVAALLLAITLPVVWSGRARHASPAPGHFWIRPSLVPEAVAPSTPLKSIAVLPFKPLVAGGRDESLEMGMADTLITRLGSIREVVVRPVSAVRQYADLEQDPVAAGRELGVESVLDGNIQRQDDRIRVTVRFLSVRDGRSLWAETFDEPFTDIFTIQDRVAEQVARSLRPTLTGEEMKVLTKHFTEDTDAYLLYLKGRYSRIYTEERARTAIKYFNQAIEADPDYALAHAGLADAYYGLSELYVPPKEAMTAARAAAMKAVELDESLAEAHTSLALVKTFYEWDWAGAEREYKQAIELNPNYAMAHEWYGWHLALTGRHDESIAQVRRAQQIDPVSLSVNWSLGVVFYFARRYDEAIRQFQTTLEMDPDHRLAHVHLGRSYFQKGMYEEAIAEMQKGMRVGGGGLSSALGYAHAATGRRDEAERILRGLKGRSQRHHVSPFDIAHVYTALGEKDLAFESLERAYEGRSERMTWLKVDPWLDGLRSDPRLTDLLGRIGLGP